MRTVPLDRGKNWNAIEADARSDWEREHRGTWEQFKDAIHYGWGKVRGRTPTTTTLPFSI